MLNVVLFEPEIPPNTGNIIRLCANTGFALHLIEPLGFTLQEKQLRRAGLDYSDLTSVTRWASLNDYLHNPTHRHLFAFTTKGSTPYDQVSYQRGDSLLFGPETRGLPNDFLQTLSDDEKIYLPMRAKNRSMNLSNVVAVASFEAWRQHNFA